MIGQTILHYRITEKLGEGGMGIVYKATDTKLKREVAIKFLPHQIQIDNEERERMKIEAQAAASLNHPNIATVHAIEETEDELFIVMEYIEGQELKGKIVLDAPTPKEALAIAIQVAEGLQAAHEKGVVHRDIKSANIMLTNKGQVKIMDFGLAKMSGAPQITKVGTTIGTSAYMSPEQVQGQVADERSDIWSYGVVLYELLTEEPPFTGPYEQAILYSVVNENPKTITEPKPNLPSSLESIVNKCLEKDAPRRYQSFDELLTDLREAANELDGTQIVPKKKEKTVRSAKPWRRIRLPILLTGAVAIILLAIFLIPKILSQLSSQSVPSRQHLLVLPLTNIGSDAAKQVFCDGLVETLTSKLSQLEQFHESLWVVPASEVRRQGINSAGEARQSFGVNLVVSGSLQSFGESYRLTLNLIDADNLRQLNSSVIDVGQTALAALQDQAAIKMLEILRLELNPKMQDVLTAGGTTIPGANEFYLQGRGYLLRYEDADNLDAAISLFKQSIEEDSQFALAHAGLGEAYWRKYESTKDGLWAEKARRQCQQVTKLNNELAPVNITLGMIHNGMGQYEIAIQDFKKALNVDPTNADAYRGLAKAYQALERYNDADLTYKRAIELKPDYWAGYNDLGVFYFRYGRYEDAIAQFQQVIMLTPDNYRGYNNLGGIYYLLERWEKAEQMFERSFSLKKSYAVSSNLGTLYFIQGKYTDAARMYETALKLNEHDYVVWGNLASAYYWAPGKRNRAADLYQRAINLAEEKQELNPNDPDLMATLAGYYSMMDNHNRSLNLIRQAIKLAPENVQVMYRAASVYEQLGDRERALHWIDKALENGYSLSEIEHQPDLRKLLEDKRFKKLAEKYTTAYKGQVNETALK